MPNETWAINTPLVYVDLDNYLLDPDSDPLSFDYSYRVDESGNFSISINDTSHVVTIIPDHDWVGNGTYRFAATDDCGLSFWSNFVTFTVTPSESVCGNHIKDPGEECDWIYFGDTTCSDISEEFRGGSLFCNDDCTINSSDCILGGDIQLQGKVSGSLIKNATVNLDYDEEPYGLIDTVYTNALGLYSITGLAAGVYSLGFLMPPGPYHDFSVYVDNVSINEGIVDFNLSMLKVFASPFINRHLPNDVNLTIDEPANFTLEIVNDNDYGLFVAVHSDYQNVGDYFADNSDIYEDIDAGTSRNITQQFTPTLKGKNITYGVSLYAFPKAEVVSTTPGVLNGAHIQVHTEDIPVSVSFTSGGEDICDGLTNQGSCVGQSGCGWETYSLRCAECADFPEDWCNPTDLPGCHWNGGVCTAVPV